MEIVLDELLKKVDSRYSLVITASKRARQLTKEGKAAANKAVVVALKEMMLDKLIIIPGEEKKNA
ncbi:DNA-directed RNA polymerase subunit omega [Peptococcaceae bacterium]|nr:DNA-directed RNA polymerase subunit omega [Peptococcaceae bacterium]MCL0052560.1 DNA-directed RNA polymerase subunit omega [Peptococcaceae bacterium]MCL0077533.1 DNA-directed RNA polymerase subunit omega [Peptococcaceae bacterium]